MLEWDKIPVVKGHLLTNEDLTIRRHLLNLMCKFETSWKSEESFLKEIPEILGQLHEMENDGLLIIGKDFIQVTESGKAFVRNICMAFDLQLQRKKPDTRLFSLTV